ncbi:MAG: hypothetical protein KFF50_02840 [Desulfatitalea sp.]|nr:hypothetical protein [Desulfatitalea sp.]
MENPILITVFLFNTINMKKGADMGILFHERRYPAHKNKEVVAAWFKAIEKYPQPEGLFTTLIDNAARPTKQGFKIISAHLIAPGKYEEAVDYFARFMTEFYDVEGFVFEFEMWSTIEEALSIISQDDPKK